MARQTQVDRALAVLDLEIADLEREIAALKSARAKLKAATKPVTPPKLRTTTMTDLQTKETKEV